MSHTRLDDEMQKNLERIQELNGEVTRTGALRRSIKFALLAAEMIHSGCTLVMRKEGQEDIYLQFV